jgi:protocatechuate 3,4-dioxygenase beta subunit
MDRKKFLVTASLAAFSISACANVKITGKKGSISSAAASGGEGPETEGEGELVGQCATTNDILGPFYRANAPVRTDLTFADLEGSVIDLKGRVLGADCITPVENALVEIWHCNTEGEYDNDSAEYLHRGVQTTSKTGEYSFKTILPGKYLNGKLFRPAHIHFRITSPTSSELVSQLYFIGDPHITKDPWASQEKAVDRIRPIVLEDVKGNLVVNLDVFTSRSEE